MMWGFAEFLEHIIFHVQTNKQRKSFKDTNTLMCQAKACWQNVAHVKVDVDDAESYGYIPSANYKNLLE